MAKGKNEILLSIALEGDQEIKQKLKAVGEAGKQSLADIERQVGRAGEGIGRRFAESAVAPLSKVQQAFAPFLEGAGVGSIAGGGLLGRILGFGGPAAAIAGLGSVALHLAKVSDDIDRQKGRLKSLGDANGFAKISGQAKQLGTSVESLQPRYEKFLAFQQELNASNSNVIHPPNFEPGDAEASAANVRVINGSRTSTPPSKEAFRTFDRALFETVRRDFKDEDQAKAITEQFEGSLYQNNGLTGEALRGLQISPSASKFVTDSLSQRLGRSFQSPSELARLIDSGGAQLSAADVINEGAKRAPEADKQAESARGVTEAFNSLKASTGRLDEAIAKIVGSPIVQSIVKSLDKASSGVDKATSFTEQHSEAISTGAKVGVKVGEALPIPAAGALGGVVGGVAGAIVGAIPESVKRAVSDPGSLAERERPETQRTGPALPATEPIATSPVLKALQERELEQQRIRDEIQGKASQPSYPTPPAPQQIPQSATQSGAPPQQQGASLFDSFIENLNAKLNSINPPNLKVAPEDAGVGLGIRGSLEDSSQNVASALKDAGTQLAQAIAEITANLKSNSSSGGEAQSSSAEVAAAGGGLIRWMDGGGRVMGPGTSTSDSIPAMLSDGEYVIRAEAARKLGRGALDWLNAGNFAEGGSPSWIPPGGLSRTQEQADWWEEVRKKREQQREKDQENSGTRSKRLSGSQSWRDWLAQLRKETGQNLVGDYGPGESPVDPFTGFDLYINGTPNEHPGLIYEGRGPSQWSTGGAVGHFASGGTVSFGDSIGHLFSGGPASDVGSIADLSGAGSGASLGHYTVDLTMGGSTFRMMSSEETAKQMSAYARDSANFQTGPSPSWAHGGR